MAQHRAALLRKAAEQGDVSAQHNMGVFYLHGEGVPRDFGESAKWYRKAAMQGNAESQYVLGELHGKGLGVPHDPDQMIAWYRKAGE